MTQSQSILKLYQLIQTCASNHKGLCQPLGVPKVPRVSRSYDDNKDGTISVYQSGKYVADVPVTPSQTKDLADMKPTEQNRALEALVDIHSPKYTPRNYE